ncbi:hypothetical protein CHS0354_026208 [Potamilus streckersoni]|uniref:Uncharacterized protein n=1 Tax=Potamilus streckersoni TaxID=2493646 RepID=A0AAE0SEW4_9BIVA|nr:hypothetical protein CHS0354_026208 [Potamilus streckersoni]
MGGGISGSTNGSWNMMDGCSVNGFDNSTFGNMIGGIQWSCVKWCGHLSSEFGSSSGSNSGNWNGYYKDNSNSSTSATGLVLMEAYRAQLTHLVFIHLLKIMHWGATSSNAQFDVLMLFLAAQPKSSKVPLAAS